jgi:hypothetical protein
MYAGNTTTKNSELIVATSDFSYCFVVIGLTVLSLPDYPGLT